MLKPISILLLPLLLTAVSPVLAVENSPDTTVKYHTPVLLTSCGQAADVLILKGLCARAGVDMRYRPHATADSLDSVKCLILVAGGSSKGLGAAKIDPEKELERVKALVKQARKNKIPILMFHVGGEARRGALSDPFNKLAAECAELMVVVKSGDADGLFSKIATAKKARYIAIENQAEAVGVLKQIYSLNKVAEQNPPHSP